MMQEALKNPGAKFMLRFVVLFLAFHYANEFYIGITAPGGYYIPFLEQHLNYVAWLRHSILFGAKIIAAVFGYQSDIISPYILQSVTGVQVRMVYSCIGLGVICFWFAFALAHSISWNRRLVWISIGVISIWVINCFRVAFIMIANIRQWNPSKYLDHHAIFNLISYILIIILICIFIRKEGIHKRNKNNNNPSESKSKKEVIPETLEDMPT